MIDYLRHVADTMPTALAWGLAAAAAVLVAAILRRPDRHRRPRVDDLIAAALADDAPVILPTGTGRGAGREPAPDTVALDLGLVSPVCRRCKGVCDLGGCLACGEVPEIDTPLVRPFIRESHPITPPATGGARIPGPRGINGADR